MRSDPDPGTGLEKDVSTGKIASCDQEAWVLTAIREVARLSYPSGIKGRIDFARDEAAINQAAVEVLETLGYEPCYENIKMLVNILDPPSNE